MWKWINRLGIALGIYSIIVAALTTSTVITAVVVNNLFDIDAELLTRALLKYLNE